MAFTGAVYEWSNEKLWADLCEGIDRPELIDDDRFDTNADRIVHYHFDSKDDLLSSFLEYIVGQYEGRLVPKR